MKHLVAIVGPTGIGKSLLALKLAQNFGGEIISADSRQVYRYMDIGTAKPSLAERAQVPHHLIDVVNPDEEFSLARYQSLACRSIEAIHRRGKLPLLTGGSGLYVWALLEGWQIPRVAPDPVFRREMERRAASAGAESLYQELVKVDQAAAEGIDSRNVRRVIRALEVQRQTGRSFSRRQTKKAPPLHTLIIGLTASRGELYRRIDSRVDGMMAQGLVAEVENLARMGYDFNLPAMSSIGYRQIGMYLKKEISLPAAVQQIKFETHRFARHQYAWFRLNDRRIHWFDIVEQSELEIEPFVAESLKGEGATASLLSAENS
jgi:tRNA dimethylallyltransferase